MQKHLCCTTGTDSAAFRIDPSYLLRCLHSSSLQSTMTRPTISPAVPKQMQSLLPRLRHFRRPSDKVFQSTTTIRHTPNPLPQYESAQKSSPTTSNPYLASSKTPTPSPPWFYISSRISRRRQLTTTAYRKSTPAPVFTPTPISPDEYHKRSDAYIDTLVAQLEEMQEEREDIDVEYSVCLPKTPNFRLPRPTVPVLF